MDPRVPVIADNCFKVAMSDAAWQAFGFKRRPLRGIISNLIKPAWRKSFETRMVREMLVAYTAAHLRGYAHDADREGLAANVFAFYVGEDGRFERNFGQIGEFEADVARYMNATEQKCSDLVSDHLGILKVPDRKMLDRLIWGAAQFPQRLGAITLLVSQHGSDMSNWPRRMSEPSRSKTS